jgi:hypothetical protein
MPVPQRVSFLLGWAGDPARKKPIENGAISPLNPLNPVHCSLPNFVLQVSREIYLKSTSTTARTIAKRSISRHPNLG